MDTLKQDLILTTVEIEGNKYTQMNMPIKEVCYRSGVAGFKLYDKLEEMGIKVEHALLLSQQDVDDYNDYGRLHRGINPFNHTPEEEFAVDVNNLITNSRYFDIEIKGENGKVGLKDSCGNNVVPPIFDSVRGIDYLFYSNCVAIVEKDGKFWFTRRDGRGIIINKNGYDSVKTDFTHAFVERDGKQGLVDMTTSKEMIPSEMDWVKQALNDFVFGRNGKLGYLSTFFEGYTEPLYDAIDMSTHRVMKDGQWGWLFEDGEFTTEIPWKGQGGEGTFPFLWRPEYYIDTDPNAEENYVYLEDMFKNLKSLEKKHKKERSRTHASRMNLPNISFPKGFKAVGEIEEPLKETIDFCLNNKKRNLIFWFGLKNDNKPLVDVHFFNIGKGMIMEMEWIDTELEDQWRDLKLPEKMQESLNVIISAGKERPVLTFRRQFEVTQLKMLAKFLTYYLIEFRQIAKEDIIASTIVND